MTAAASPTVTVRVDTETSAPASSGRTLYILRCSFTASRGITGTAEALIHGGADARDADGVIPGACTLMVTINAKAEGSHGQDYGSGSFGWVVRGSVGKPIAASDAAVLDAISAALRTEVEQSDAYRAAAAEALTAVERQIARLERLRAQLASAAQADR